MPTRAFYLFDFVLFSLPQHLVRRVPSNRWWVEHDDAVRSRWNYSPVPVLEKFVVTFYIMDDILKTREVCVMGQESRIKPGRNQFARLISEVDGLCPLCQEELIVSRNGSTTNLSQAAHIYPHSPTTSEKELLKNVPRLSNDPESIENLIMLCPNCHHKFDNPRTGVRTKTWTKLRWRYPHVQL